MTNIVRTPTRAEGGITPDERARMDDHAKLWIARAMRTDPIEPDKIVPAIEALYAAAGLKKPRVVIAPSPIVMAFAYGASAAIWYNRNATDDATDAATNDATRATTRVATNDATRAATDAETRGAVAFRLPRDRAAVLLDATRDAIDVATRAVIHDATYDATDGVTRAAIYGVAAVASKFNSVTDAATRAVTRDAIEAASLAVATDAATGAATDDATYTGIRDAIRAATNDAAWISVYAATDDATRAMTRDAIPAAYSAADAATDAGIRAAIRNATRNAADAATYVAIDAGIRAAMGDVTRNATRNATDALDVSTYDATYGATHTATNDTADRRENEAATACMSLAGPLGVECARKWVNAYQGGNMWASLDCYLTAARDILGLKLESHNKYEAWENAAIHGGFRVMHAEFCIVSDFPEVLKVDDQNRPHCESGPSHRWRDGWSLYHWHGVKVPAHWIEHRDALTAAEIFKEENAETRRAGCEIIGWDRVLSGIDAKLVDADGDPMIGTLYRGQIPGAVECGFLKVLCGTGREFVIPVAPEINTAIEAQAWIQNVPTSEWTRPEVRG